MKINLHCHSDYSGGHDLMEMAMAHKEQGFSAFVVTDHVYPLFLADDKEKQYSLCIMSYDKYQTQTAHLQKISKELDFPCFQGIELALYGEEILIFGDKAIKEVFDYMSEMDLNEQKKYGKTAQYKQKIIKNLLSILKKNKENSAIILCHPHLIETPKWVLNPLYKIIDGYEMQNGRTYYFEDPSHPERKKFWPREIPEELKNKNKFYNSDAHSPLHIKRNDGNFHNTKITSIDDLISYIKNTKDGQMQINIRPNKSFERV